MATVKLDPAKGVQIPNKTTTERNAISSPETGALIWNTTTSAVNQYNGSAWGTVGISEDTTKLPLAGGAMTGTITNFTSTGINDDASGAIAARLWWMLRWIGHESVFVLDGGIQAWERAGLPLEISQPIWESTEFLLHEVHEEWVVQADEILNEMEQGAILVDARSRDRFCGVSEPIDPVAGHVPGAVNYPFSEALDSIGLMRNSKELQQDLEAFAKGDRGLIAMCGSGVTACHLLLALRVAELGDGRAYIGSWSQWIRNYDHLIATGDDFDTTTST